MLLLRGFSFAKVFVEKSFLLWKKKLFSPGTSKFEGRAVRAFLPDDTNFISEVRFIIGVLLHCEETIFGLEIIGKLLMEKVKVLPRVQMRFTVEKVGTHMLYKFCRSIFDEN